MSDWLSSIPDNWQIGIATGIIIVLLMRLFARFPWTKSDEQADKLWEITTPPEVEILPGPSPLFHAWRFAGFFFRRKQFWAGLIVLGLIFFVATKCDEMMRPVL
ncbi:MAG: hypothetical protein WAW96_16295 [Alphaproteobacteria bacterium]